MRVVKADPDSDAERLSQFFGTIELNGPVDFTLSRKNFFDQYRMQSDEFETLMLVDSENVIQGVVSIVFHHGVVHGEQQKWALATDLRISQSRQAVVAWSDLFLPELLRIRAEHGCQYVFAAVMQYDNLAYNALIRPRSERRHGPRYYLLNRFRSICIHGRWPLTRDPLPSIEIDHALTDDLHEICEFLTRHSGKRTLALNHDLDDLLDRIHRHPDMKLEDMLLARDHAGKIVGTALPWRSDLVTQWTPVRYHGFALGVYSALWWVSKFRIIQGLPGPQEPFKSKVLTHLNVDNPDILKALIDHAYNQSENGELILYPYFRNDWKMLPPLSFVSTSIPWGLYLVLPPNEEQPRWLIPDHHNHSPEFQLEWL